MHLAACSYVPLFAPISTNDTSGLKWKGLSIFWNRDCSW